MWVWRVVLARVRSLVGLHGSVVWFSLAWAAADACRPPLCLARVQYIEERKGIPSEADYPYCSGTGDCYPCEIKRGTPSDFLAAVRGRRWHGSASDGVVVDVL